MELLSFSLYVLLLCSILLKNVQTQEGGSSQQQKKTFDFREDVEERLRPHYALNHKKAEELAFVEEIISATLTAFMLVEHSNYIFHEYLTDDCLHNIKRYLKEFQKDSDSLAGKSGFIRAKSVSENPLLLYRMIRRMHIVLFGEIFKTCGGDHADLEVKDTDTIGIIDAIENKMKIAGLAPITQNDLDDALLGILRIHYVYGFKATTELRFGIFGDVRTNVTLNFGECLDLGETALTLNATILAYQWFSSAELALKEEKDTDKNNTINLKASFKLKDSWKKLLKQVKVKNVGALHSIMGKIVREEDMQPNFYPYEKYASCREQSYLSETEKSKLKCFLSLGLYIPNPYWTIQPLKIEILHNNPQVWLFHDFVGNRTIKYLRNHVYKSGVLARSGIIAESGEKTEYTFYRTSMQSWIHDSEFDVPGEEVHSLSRRIELCTGFHLIKKGASQALQIVDYSSLGGHYDYHDDTMGSEILQDDGERLATFLLFLSDVKMGGFTAFPKLNIGVKPELGSAILWFSLRRNGEPDSRHTHGGCPVILGSKLIANKWIMQYENMFRHQCSLNPDE